MVAFHCPESNWWTYPWPGNNQLISRSRSFVIDFNCSFQSHQQYSLDATNTAFLGFHQRWSPLKRICFWSRSTATIDPCGWPGVGINLRFFPRERAASPITWFCVLQVWEKLGWKILIYWDWLLLLEVSFSSQGLIPFKAFDLKELQAWILLLGFLPYPFSIPLTIIKPSNNWPINEYG